MVLNCWTNSWKLSESKTIAFDKTNRKRRRVWFSKLVDMGRGQEPAGNSMWRDCNDSTNAWTSWRRCRMCLFNLCRCHASCACVVPEAGPGVRDGAGGSARVRRSMATDLEISCWNCRLQHVTSSGQMRLQNFQPPTVWKSKIKRTHEVGTVGTP